MTATVKLSSAQKIFMNTLKEGNFASRDIFNVTGKALAKKGLVKFVAFYGWILTPTGAKFELGDK